MIKRNIYLLWGIALLQGMVFYAPVATLYRQAAGLGIFHITLLPYRKTGAKAMGTDILLLGGERKPDIPLRECPVLFTFYPV